MLWVEYKLQWIRNPFDHRGCLLVGGKSVSWRPNRGRAPPVFRRFAYSHDFKKNRYTIVKSLNDSYTLDNKSARGSFKEQDLRT